MMVGGLMSEEVIEGKVMMQNPPEPRTMRVEVIYYY